MAKNLIAIFKIFAWWKCVKFLVNFNLLIFCEEFVKASGVILRFNGLTIFHNTYKNKQKNFHNDCVFQTSQVFTKFSFIYKESAANSQ